MKFLPAMVILSKKNGVMDKYFKKQEWYRPQHKNVAHFLTEIELFNIKLIQQNEKRSTK